MIVRAIEYKGKVGGRRSHRGGRIFTDITRESSGSEISVEAGQKLG